ncbi:hypothetical protein ACE4Y5_03630 [Enterococcus faecalis]|uniref:hypothetical protein n=1 Tax=Enterococcus faecalis TaxID=1351 RepID=UPI0035CC4C90
MKIELCIEDTQRKSKPNSDEVRMIQNVLYKKIKKKEIDDIAESIAVNGKTSMLATYFETEEFSERIHSINFKQQQLIMLDFDNSKVDIEKYGMTTYDYVKNHDFIKQNACFIYRTFSDKESSVDKFRVVFMLNESIKDYLLIGNIYTKLFRLFPSADRKCSNPNRLFFGSNRGYEEIHFSNLLNVKEFTSDIVPMKKTVNKIVKTEISNEQYEIQDRKLVWQLIKENTKESIDEARAIILNKFDSEISKVYPSYTNARVILRQSIAMREFLELPMIEPFHDILEKDEKPSASVMKWEDGTQIYHRFNKDSFANLDILRVISKLLNLTGYEAHYKSIDLLLYLTCSELDRNSKTAEQIDKIQFFRKILKNEKLAIEYPKFTKFLGSDLRISIALLDTLSEFMYEDFKTGEVRHLLCLTSENIAKEINHILGTKYDSKRIQRVINKLAITENIEKLEESQIPADLFAKYTEKSYEKIVNNKYHHTNFIEFKDADMEKSENISKELYANNYTLNALNFEGIARILGKDIASNVFKQRETTVSSKNIKVDKNLLSESKKENEIKIASYILRTIEKQNYVSEKDVIFYVYKYMLKEKTKKDAEYLVKQCRANICKDYDLELIRVTNSIRDNYNMPKEITSRSIMYVRNN